jgi:hypothetical protein
MVGKKGLGVAGLMLLGLLAFPAAASAWWWHDAPCCPRGEYCHLHYWFTEWYRARAHCRPSYLDQYAPGPIPEPPIDFQYLNPPCRAIPTAPPAPYANPQGYFGRPTALPFVLP